MFWLYYGNETLKQQYAIKKYLIHTIYAGTFFPKKVLKF